MVTELFYKNVPESQARNQGGGIWGICHTRNFQNIAILTFIETFKE